MHRRVLHGRIFFDKFLSSRSQRSRTPIFSEKNHYFKVKKRFVIFGELLLVLFGWVRVEAWLESAPSPRKSLHNDCFASNNQRKAWSRVGRSVVSLIRVRHDWRIMINFSSSHSLMLIVLAMASNTNSSVVKIWEMPVHLQPSTKSCR